MISEVDNGNLLRMKRRKNDELQNDLYVVVIIVYYTQYTICSLFCAVCKTFIPGPNPGGTSIEGPVAFSGGFFVMLKCWKSLYIWHNCTD